MRAWLLLAGAIAFSAGVRELEPPDGIAIDEEELARCSTGVERDAEDAVRPRYQGELAEPRPGAIQGLAPERVVLIGSAVAAVLSLPRAPTTS